MASRYEKHVSRDIPNNAHAYMLCMVGRNQRVLELGAASGFFTRALVAQSCRVTAVEFDEHAAEDLKLVADRVVIGDLNDPGLLSGLTPEFDVVLAGDVLEHLAAPQAVLNRVVHLLAPGGRVIVSLPNIAHVDVRLSLLQGQFDYQPAGLLDETHLRFFTLKTVYELVESAGLLITDLKRVRFPPFETEINVDRARVSQAVLEAVLADPEAETYQFVFSAVRDNGDRQVKQLAQRSCELQAELERALIRIQALEHEAQLHAEAEARWGRIEQELNALRDTKVIRYTKHLRSAYAWLRKP